MKLNDKLSQPLRVSVLRAAVGVGLVAGMLLLIPLLAMQFSEEVQWTVFDFAAAWVLLFGAGFTFVMVARTRGSLAYRAAVAVAVFTSLFLVWSNLAVGIIGSEDNPVNIFFFFVIMVEVIAVILARLKPRKMATAMFATAIAHALVPLLAFVVHKPELDQGTITVIGINVFFIFLWIVSGLFFRNAATDEMKI